MHKHRKGEPVCSPAESRRVFRVLIPARYDSTRLPGKLLLDIAGKPMLQHTYERALKSGAKSVVIATDSKEIKQAAEAFGAEVCMTSSAHQSGTDRLAEAAKLLAYQGDEIIVNVQGDEPRIAPEIIRQVAKKLHEQTEAPVATLCQLIQKTDELFNPNIVKVVRDKNQHALYFSRAPIAWIRDNFSSKNIKLLNKLDIDANTHFSHIGLYAYRANFLQDYSEWPSCELEEMEKLEQLRILWHGTKIHVDLACAEIEKGIDTEDDLQRVRALYLIKEKKL